MQIFNIVIAGVGGQGVLLASKVLAESALASGMDVKQNEVKLWLCLDRPNSLLSVHGLSQMEVLVGKVIL